MLRIDPEISNPHTGMPRPTLREIDDGRARAGLMVIALCSLFWLAVTWLILKVL